MVEDACEGRAGLASLLDHSSTTSGRGRRRAWLNVVSEEIEAAGGAIWVVLDVSAAVPALDVGLSALLEIEELSSSLGAGEGRTAAELVEVEG